jgi:predicted ABC-type ATPase
VTYPAFAVNSVRVDIAMQEGKQPTVYAIAGPNGAGKTTFAVRYLPAFADCREFVNADLIATGLSPFAPETQAIRAGRLLLTRIKELWRARSSFGFETTLAGRGYVRALQGMKEAGYRVELIFLWLPNAELAVARVANRVSQGGHGVPVETIRRRFDAGLRNLFHAYLALMDAWYLYDASRYPPILVAHEDQGQRHVHEPELFGSITSIWGDASQ